MSAALVLGATSVAAQDTTRAITKIAGDLYRFQNNFHLSVFLVTDEGIIATDPINAEAAMWLKGELASRFNVPVRYLVYSHDHVGHIAGGEVFADTAVVVAHENAKADIIGEQRPNAVPDITFSDEMVIELGGKTVELRYLGRNHSDNSIVVNFPAERTLFAVDFVRVGTVQFADLGDSYIDEWVDSLKAGEQLDFDILVPGHGPLGDRSHFTESREYLEPASWPTWRPVALYREPRISGAAARLGSCGGPRRQERGGNTGSRHAGAAGELRKIGPDGCMGTPQYRGHASVHEPQPGRQLARSRGRASPLRRAVAGWSRPGKASAMILPLGARPAAVL